jgi:hypothetical protein
VGAVTRLPAGRVLFRQRLAAGVSLSIGLLCIANYYLNLGLFGRFAKQAIASAFAVMYLQIHFYGPTIHRLRAYQRLKRSRLLRALREVQG